MMRLAISLKRWINTGLAFFYPETCQLCRKERAGPEEGYVGANCREDVKFIVPPYCKRCGMPFRGAIETEFECSNCNELDLYFETARAAVATRGVVLDAIHRYKYTRAMWFEPFLADLLVRRAVAELKPVEWDWIVPVPLHPVKEREREFNQAERLGRHLSKATRIPLEDRVLRRVRPTGTQTRLSAEERRENMRDAFDLVRGASPKGRRIVLLDDVLTTGATTNACAKVLRRHGAASVCVWTVARGV